MGRTDIGLEENMMTCQLLPWVLATLACAGSWNADDPADDPYLWLEEVAGAKADGLGQRA